MSAEIRSASPARRTSRYHSPPIPSPPNPKMDPRLSSAGGRCRAFLIFLVFFVGSKYAAGQVEFSFHYETKLLQEVNSITNPVSERRDIVIFGDIVTIDKPLMSFGGDVVVIANHLRLLAPIDTRPLIKLSGKYWRAKPPLGGLWLPDTLRANQRLLREYDTYYFWREVYQPETRFYVRTYEGISTLDERLSNHPPNVILSDAGPSAPVPNVWVVDPPIDGVDAPPIERSAIRSGDIYVLAGSVAICGTQGEPCLPKTPLSIEGVSMDYGDNRARRVLLMADGLKGGYGSPAPPPACFGTPAQCNYWPSGRSGRASRGFDAGSVRVAYAQDIDVGEVRFRELISAKGGVRPYAGRFSTPSINQIEHLNLGSRFVLRDTTSPDTEPGLSGTVSVFRITDSLVAIGWIGSQLGSMSLGRDYKLAKSLTQATPSTALTLTPRRALSMYLRGETARINSLFLDRALDSVVGKRLPNPEPSAIPIPWNSGECDSRFSPALTDEELLYWRSLCVATTSLSHPSLFLLYGGGLFGPLRNTLLSELQSASIAHELSLLNSQQALAISELQKISDQMATQLELTERVALKEKLDKAVNFLNAAKAQNDASLPRIPSIPTLVTGLAGLGDALRGASKILESDPGGWKPAGDYLRSNRKNYESYLNAFVSLARFQGTKDLRTLEQEVSDALSSLQQFDQQVSDAHRDRLARLSHQLGNFLKLAEQVDDKRHHNVLLFPDVLRAIIQAYYVSPQRSELVLEKNSYAIKNLLTDASQSPIPLAIETLEDKCLAERGRPLSNFSGSLGCLLVKRHFKDWKVIWGTHNDLKLPLLVVAPGTGDVTATIAGFPSTSMQEQRLSSKRLHQLKTKNSTRIDTKELVKYETGIKHPRSTAMVNPTNCEHRSVESASAWGGYAEKITGITTENALTTAHMLCSVKLKSPTRKIVVSHGLIQLNFTRVGGSGGGVILNIYTSEASLPSASAPERGFPIFSTALAVRTVQNNTMLTLEKRPDDILVDLGNDADTVTIGLEMSDPWVDTALSASVYGIEVSEW